jgi:hypothetical protein|tara:strand:- start:46 stop:441 length:396 start_codon:yes stop_codon:yes gene_type:complete
MKYLSEILEQRQTKLFNKHAVFFAFSNEQFKKGIEKCNLGKGEKVVNLGSGMFCPKVSASKFLKEHKTLVAKAIQEDLEQGREAVILRELSNYECFVTGNIDDCVSALEDYKIKEDEIVAVYRKNYEEYAE